MDIIKNPVIIGLFAGVLTYLYMSWTIDEKNKKAKKNKNKKVQKEEVNLLIPLVVSVIVWFVSYGYFEFNDVPAPLAPQFKQPIPLMPDVGFRFTKDVIPSSTSNTKEFSLLTGGVTVPSVLPDVLIDMF